MSAHTIATKQYAQERVEFVIERLRQNTSHQANHFWISELETALEQPTGGTLRDWMQRHHDEPIDTLQVTLAIDPNTAQPRVTDAWAPGVRRVDATSRATAVFLNQSTREYAGVTTLTATGRVYVGFAKWGTDVQLLAYSA